MILSSLRGEGQKKGREGKGKSRKRAALFLDGCLSAMLHNINTKNMEKDYASKRKAVQSK